MVQVSAQAQKIKKKFLYFRKQNPRKKFLYIFAKKAVLIFQKTESPKKFVKFQGTELSYISGSNFPSLKNKKKLTLEKLLIFREMELYSPKKLNKTPFGETGCLSNH